MKQDYVQAIDDRVREMMQDIHTIMPGKIVRYEKGFVDVKPSASFTTPGGEKMPYPVVVNVPIVVPHCCDIAIAVPIKAGDDCLLVIAEQSIDGWMAGAEDDTDLRYDLTNAICIPGLCRTPVQAQEEANRSGQIVLYGNVKIKGNLTVTGTVTSS